MIARLAALALVLGLLSACGDDDRPVRILLVGDSVTQGSAGDWTWRYRLWEHLVADDADVDFVGPADTLAGPPPALPNQEYADPDFDRTHAAHWGDAFYDTQWPIGDLVETYEPDVVVELLGVNDLVGGKTPDEVLAELSDFVTTAQQVDPDVDVVLGQLSQSWQPGVPDYNAGLPGLAQELGTDDSRVVVATAPTDFVEDVDTWDAAHPTATGEVKIAASVADALAELDIGTNYPRPFPTVDPVPIGTPDLAVVPGPTSAALTWTLPPGTDQTWVWVRDATLNGAWERRTYALGGTTWTDQGLVSGHTYEYRVQPAKGASLGAHLSAVVSVTAG